MKPKTMILMVVAVICGLGASFMTSKLLAERDDKKPQVVVQEIPKVKLLVARKHVDIGTLIKNPQELFTEREFVKDFAPKEAINDLKALQGKTMRRSLRKGDHINPDDFSDAPPTLEVPPGHQAIGLRVTVDAIAAGFASLPGSRVDIIWNRRKNNDDQSFSTRLLQNVLVLAADTRKNALEDGGAMPASVVTLALTPEDTQRVSLASEHGTLRLVLRRPDDNTVTEDQRPYTVADLIKNRRSQRTEVKEEPLVDVPPVTRPEPTVAPKEDPEPVVQAKPRRTHVVWFQQGPRQWKEVFYLDDNGNVITDDVQRHEPEAGAAPAPGDQPAAPAPRNPGQGKAKD
jgi:pilus assembly protein CpaB